MKGQQSKQARLSGAPCPPGGRQPVARTRLASPNAAQCPPGRRSWGSRSSACARGAGTPAPPPACAPPGGAKGGSQGGERGKGWVETAGMACLQAGMQAGRHTGEEEAEGRQKPGRLWSEARSSPALSATVATALLHPPSLQPPLRSPSQRLFRSTLPPPPPPWPGSWSRSPPRGRTGRPYTTPARAPGCLWGV